MKKKFLFSTIVICIGILHFGITSVLADSAIADSGTWGNLTWSIDANGTLVIDGEGEMLDNKNFEYPWNPNIVGNKKIKAVEIGDNVTSIATGAFFQFSNMQSVHLPLKLETINDYAFFNCISLEQIELPIGLTYIGSDAFAQCKLKDISIPDNVTHIGFRAFALCSNLEKITLPYIGSPDGYDRFIGYIFGASTCEGNTKMVPASLKHVVLSEKCKTIPLTAFYKCTSIEKIEISKNVTTIGSYAFEGCTGIKEFEIPDNVKTIYSSAFRGCTQLSNIKISNNVTQIPNYCFENCTNLSQIDFGNALEEIGELAFNNCTSLTEIFVPNTVTSIKKGAFKGCSNLESISLPFVGNCREANNCPEAVFGYIFDYTSNNYGSGTRQFYDEDLFYNYYIPTSIKEVKITDEMIIPYGAFYGCTFENLELPSSINKIDNMAFSINYGLKDLYFIGSREQWNSIYIGAGNEMLNNVTIHFSKSLPLTISYVADNALGVPIKQEVEPFSSIKISSIIPMKNNYIFKGWATDKQLGTVNYKPGDNITILSEDIILYAVWQRIVTTSTQIISNIIMVTPTNAQIGDYIIAACYKGGQMVYVDIYSYNNETTIPFVPDKEYDKIKIMVLESMNTLVPLSIGEDISISQ